MLTPLAAVTISILGHSLPATDELRFRMLDLGPVTYQREAGVYVNSKGWVLASRWNGPGWYWRPGVGWRQLPTYPGYRFTAAFAVNDRGAIACRLNNGGHDAAGIWDEARGVRKIEMPLGSSFSHIISINNQDEIVGSCDIDLPSYRSQGWYWREGSRAIGLGLGLNGEPTAGMSINNLGVVSGHHWVNNQPSVHFWRDRRNYVDLGHPPSGHAYANNVTINDDLLIEAGNVGVQEDVRWNDGTWYSLGNQPGSNEEWAVKWLNDSRWAVGLGSYNNAWRAIIWRPGYGAKWADELVDDSKTGYTIQALYCVSNNGLITGQAIKPGDRYSRPILLVPYPKKSAGG